MNEFPPPPSAVRATPKVPSLTIWSRLEPRVRGGDMERALQAQVRDGWWFLARQWQVGEFLGEDAASPVSATIRTESVALTSYRPGPDAPVERIDAGPPLEAHVEREAHVPTLRDSVRLGLHFQALLHEHGHDGHIGAFENAFPIAKQPPAGELRDVQARRYRAAVAGRVVDGEALVNAALPQRANLRSFGPIAGMGGDRTAVAGLLEDLIKHRESLYSEPAGDSPWVAEQLEYDFAVGSESQAGSAVFHAARFGGGHLDWHAFVAEQGELAPPAGQQVRVEQQSFIPNGVTFRGMPATRWWDFEDGLTDFGALDTEHVDLAKLIVMEFALVYGDDWFELPLPLDIGSLNHIDALIVTDTFGERTIVPPTGSLGLSGDRPWSVFGLTGVDPERDLLLLPPLVGEVQEGPVLEDVLFARDEMALLGWGIERTLEGALGAPVDGYQAWHDRLAAEPPAVPRTRKEDEPPIEYVLGTDVPDNWIPLVPVQVGPDRFRFRRGIMGGPGGQPARGRLLEPGHPLYIAEQAIPREGVEVTRRFRRARWIDGSTHLWMARRAGIGRGEGSSGLEFDALRDVPKEPPS